MPERCKGEYVPTWWAQRKVKKKWKTKGHELHWYRRSGYYFCCRCDFRCDESGWETF